MYGKPITMNFDGNSSHIKTSCGGLVTILVFVVTFLYSAQQLNFIFNYTQTEFTLSTYMPDMDDVGMQSLQDFDKTFNMLINIRNQDFDWFDNPYITPNIYHIDANYKPKLTTTIKFKSCDRADLLKFMPETELSWYPNALCFADKSQIKLKGNWYASEFNSIYISLDYCKGPRCKSKAQIDEFL